jgi:hypothetical protein
MDLFTLVARLGMDSSEYERGVSKARGSFSELGSFMSAKAVAMGNMISSAINKAVNVAADLGKSAIQNAADVAAEKAQFKATFDVLQGEAEAAFKDIEKSTGVFGTRLQNVGTKAFSQFKGAGLDGVQALDMMKDYTELAADAAAYYDISLEDADARLRSFLRGNTEAGDAIGLFTSESQRNSAAMEKYGKKWQKLTEAQKQMLMLDISKDIYEQSGAIGQAARESDSWTNVIGNLKEAWRQATALIGAPIMSALTPVIQNITNFLNDENTQTLLTRFGLTIVNVAKSSFENVKAFIDDVSAFMSDNEIPITTVIAAVMGLWAVTNPFSALLAALGYLIVNWKDVKKWTDETLTKTRIFFQTTYNDKISPILSGISGWFQDIWDKIDAAITKWKEFIGYQNGTPTNPTEKSQVQSGAMGSYVGGGTSYAPASSYAAGASLPRNAGGLYYARNNYITKLDEGEAVLTQREATDWRAGRSGGNAEVIAAIRDLSEAIFASRQVMTPDGRVLGDITTETVSRNMANAARGRRYGYGW